MPPSLIDWVGPDHLVWTVLESVEQLDLAAFYAAYRRDGRSRPAYDPAVMVALLLYAYARGNRSSRRIERACLEDVAYRVITANRAPDHSTIAEFRVRHEQALGELFGGVLELCRRAGLVSVGVIAVDGTKVMASASSYANVDYRRIAKEIIEEAARTDREEDALYGPARGDELPEHLRTPEGRRAALREAKRQLDEERQRDGRAESQPERLEEPKPVAPAVDENQGALFCLRLEPEGIVERAAGRRGWLLAARRQLKPASRRERTVGEPVADRAADGGRAAPRARARSGARGQSGL